MLNRFEISALALLTTSLAHTAIAPKWMSDAKFKTLPKVARAYSMSGWYQGSLFFLMTALINYRWSRLYPQGGLTDPVDKGIAAIFTILSWGSAWWYYRHGIADTSVAVGATGLVQFWAAFL